MSFGTCQKALYFLSEGALLFGKALFSLEEPEVLKKQLLGPRRDETMWES